MPYFIQTERFILECLRAESENDFALLKRNFLKKQDKIDWLSITQHSAKLLPLLGLRILKHCKGFSIPHRTLAQIKFGYLLTVKQNKKIKQLIEELARECARADIKIIFLKGAALLATVYQHDDGLRPMEDVDILVRKDALSKLENVISRIGYREDYQKLSRQFNTTLSRDFFLQRHLHLIYFMDALRLEVHWDISYERNTDIVELLWRTHETKMLGETHVNILNGEGSIFIACLNFHKDFLEIFAQGWFQLNCKKKQAFYYILFFLNELKGILEYYKDSINWDSLCRLAKVSRKEYEIFTLLLLAKKVLRIDMPPFIFLHSKGALWLCIYAFCSWFKSAEQVYELVLMREKIYAVYKVTALFRKNPKKAFRQLCFTALHYFIKPPV